MEIQRLRLNQYRNYSSLELRPSPGLNVIVGDNAMGKTNAAEAVFLCAFGRSHRTGRDSELIMWGCDGGYVGADVLNSLGHHTIELRLRAGERKKIAIDSQQAARSGELMGILNVVLFAPESLETVTGGPSERRRFLDMELSQLYPAYYYRLQRYNAALRHRNALIRDSAPQDTIAAYSEVLAAEGANIMQLRREFIERLAPVTERIHGGISSGSEKLTIAYRPDVVCRDVDGADALMEVFSSSLNEDMRRCTTTRGPHRDDMTLTVNGCDIRAYGSQGQKRTAALSLKLSEMDIIERIKGEPPVLILDDVLSELDPSRQSMLKEVISRCQCFLTCTTTEGTGLIDGGAAVFRCESGSLRAVNSI